MKGEDMALLDRIANYFMEWDGIDETAPKMELSIHELRYIADMNVERCRLIRQLNEANLKTEKLLMDKTQEIRAKAIDEFAEKLNTDVESFVAEVDGVRADLLTLDYFSEFVFEVAEQLKGGAK